MSQLLFIQLAGFTEMSAFCIALIYWETGVAV